MIPAAENAVGFKNGECWNYVEKNITPRGSVASRIRSASHLPSRKEEGVEYVF